MPESTLSLALPKLEEEVGFFLGYGRGADAGDPDWTDSQAAAIDRCIRSGLRQFYYPPPMNGVSHEWSFLRPIAQIALASGDQEVDLPDDFGGLEGKITVSGQTGCWVTVVNEAMIRQRYADYSTSAGRPQMVAMVPIRGTSGTEGQRFKLTVWPAASDSYTLEVPYSVLPQALSTRGPYHYGGAQHAETILESCLAVAEKTLDDSMAVHAMAFMERLAASISLDRKNRPHLVGRLRNGRYPRTYREELWITPVTFNGVQY